MRIIIQNSSMTPVYKQIIDQVKALIFDGTLKQNDVMPSIRSLAKELKVSALTVKKAYDVLEKEEFICTVHGKGSFVLSVNESFKKENYLYKTQLELEKIIKNSKQNGVTTQEIRELVEFLLKSPQ